MYSYPDGYTLPPFQNFSPSGFPFPGGGVATAYTQSVSPGTINVPGTVTITYTLNGTAPGGGVQITPAASSFGSFGTGFVTIPFGQTVGTDTFTSSYVGTTTLSSANNQDLTDPSAITFAGQVGGGSGSGAGTNIVNITRPVTANW